MTRFALVRRWLRTLALPLALATVASCGGAPASAKVAQRHLVRGDFEAATAAADASIAKHPKDPTSWRVRIRAAMAQGELALAAAHYQEWKTLRGKHDKTTYHIMATATLWQGLRVPSSEVKARTIRIIANREVEKLATDVRDAMGDDNDLVAATAAVALLRSHPAAPKLASELLSSPSAQIRALLVQGIGKKVGRVALGDIAPLLTDSDAAVRRAATKALASWKHTKDVPRLVALASGDSDGPVRAQALRGLLAKGGDAAVAVAKKALADDYAGARLAALALLERFAEEDALGAARTLLTGEDAPLAMRAAVLVHKADGTSQEPAVKRIFASEAWSDRALALNSAAEVMPPQAAQALAEAGASDDHPSVRIAAARLHIRLGQTERGIALLEAAMAESTLGPRLAAATELARQGHGEAAALLGTLAGTGGIEQRLQAVAAHTAAQVVSDGLVAALGDSNIDVRLAAADVLLGL